VRAVSSGLALIAVAAVAGCGGGPSHARRDAVNAYLSSLRVAQGSLVRQTASIDTAYRSFSLGGNSAAETRALVQAHALLVRTRARVAALRPPADARRLHAESLVLLDLEASLAGDLVRAADYAPQLARALKPLVPARAVLARELTGAKSTKASAAAFAHYRVALAGVLEQLDTLSAPPELRPGLEGERALLARSVELCSKVEAALVRRDTAGVNAGVKGLSDLAVSPVAERSRREQAAAARAYNKRLDRISLLTVRIADERSRLVRELG
jgi:hypothetical protein